MAYNRHIGTNNEAITYQKLNTIEDAVSELSPASSSRAITVNASFVSSDGNRAEYELDKTGNEIYSYILGGNNVVIVVNDPTFNVQIVTPVLSVDEGLTSDDPDGGYGSIKCMGNDSLENGIGFTLESANSYPTANLYIY